MSIVDSLVYHTSNMPLVGSLGYLLCVEYLRKAMDKREEPIAVAKPLLVLYNAAQVVINAYVAYALFAATGGAVWGMGMSDTPAVRYGVWLHYLCKVTLVPSDFTRLIFKLLPKLLLLALLSRAFADRSAPLSLVRARRSTWT